MLADPGNRERAPEPLRLVQAFVNTLDIENGVEELESPEALARVVAEIGAWAGDGPTLGAADLEVALATREALRRLALANNGVSVASGELEALDRVAAAARLTLCVDGGRLTLVPQAQGLEGALGRILAAAYGGMADGTWRRLKACPREVCHWVFYDRSRNGSGKWCSMSVCGNRVNTSAYRHRHASTT